MKSFEQFILETEVKNQLKKVALAVSIDMEDNIYVNKHDYNAAKLFVLYTKEDAVEPNDLPVFNYSNWKIEKIVKDGYNADLVYNTIEAKEKVSSKVDWHKLHKDSDYVTTVAYDVESAKDLKFPIIAKPENRYAGQGIQVFDSIEALEKADTSDFAIFSEMIDIDRELRVFCWKGELLQICNRIPANEHTKDISKKDKEDRIKFNWELDTTGVSDELTPIIEDCAKIHSDLQFYSVDFAITTDGKPYVIEMSTEPGPIYGIMCHVYKKVYEDFYGEALSPEALKQIDTYIKEDIQATIDSDKKRFSVK